MKEINLGLRTAIENGNCILFLGAGIGRHSKMPDGRSTPDGYNLAREIADHFSIEVESKYDLAQIASIAELRTSRSELILFLKEKFSDIQPDEKLLWLFSQHWGAIYTTNYDSVIQRSYEILSKPPQRPITISLDHEITEYDTRFEVPIFHVHGFLSESTNPNIIITEDDYSKFREARRMLFQLMKIKFKSSPVLYIGYSNQDSNWKVLIKEMQEEFYPAEIPQSYRIAPNTNPLEKEILESKNITTLDCTYEEFQELASSTLKDSSHSTKQYQEIRKKIPSDLLDAFNNNQASVARLINSWEYVNQVPFHEKSNMGFFLRGDKPNWALVGNNEAFERDIEEEIILDLLDFATNPKNKPRGIIVLGPAGYGTTTLLMKLASRLVFEKAGPVFTLKAGSQVLEGDIEFASEIFREKTFIFIDDAARFADRINTILQRLKDKNSPTMLVLGSRLNEWRQSHGKFNLKEYIIDSLSDPEISRLLKVLESNRELGVLEHLDYDLQVATIKGKHGKELLVTLREITEGKSFDAIIEDEYKNINTDFARRFYLAVCCLYQHGVYGRVELLSDILDINLAKMYDNTTDSTEGVVLYECINEANSQYAARARHRTIAKIVWERCATSIEKDDLLKKIIGKINLNYGLDKNIFEDIIQSDHIIDQINTLDGKIQFFEKAINKDPNSPYVKQHYARMLRREGKLNLALETITNAIKENPKVRVLYHTQGLILMDMALSIESHGIGLRRLAQSEQSFRTGLSFYSRDEYSYQGLAQLYIGWAEKVDDPDESIEYITKAENIISEGLSKVQVKSGLWVESANIQRYLGDEPSRLSALEKAVEITPGSIVPRYLLGRQYRLDGEFTKALVVLKPTIENHSEEFRSFVEYAISLAILNKSYDESINVLKISTLYGYSDPRFIATLGGMLFMSKKFDEAQVVFDQSIKNNLSGDEMNEIKFKPWDFQNPLNPCRFRGIVIVKKAGYSLIEAKGFKPFLCPGSKYDGLIISEDMEITFQPVFSARGSIAISPKLLDD